MYKYLIKITNVIMLIFITIFVILGASQEIELQEYNGTIEHLNFNTLISYPDKILNQENQNSSIYDETKITPSEFKKILQELYSNNFILISLSELYFIDNNIIYPKKLLLPKNKKPLVLSFNNVTYKSSYQNTGEIDKIIIDNEDRLATYSTKQSIQNRIAHDNEFLPILESFIQDNPSFSFNNARGIIFFTINNGILGYKINNKNSSSKHDIKRVSEIVRRLKNLGWEFGSNNYDNSSDFALNEIEFINNICLWKKHISPIINSTPHYSSFNGENITIDETKLKVLLDNNFYSFFYDSNTPNLTIKNNYLLMSKKRVDGNSLRNNPEIFTDLFDCKKVYDNQTRLIPYPNKN